MSPLWITLHFCRDKSSHYLLQTHFIRPTRVGTKRESNYAWRSPDLDSTANTYKAVTSLPYAISDLIKEASVTYNEPPDTLYQQFVSGEVALQISDDGVTVYKPYDKNRVRGEVGELKQQVDQVARKETLAIKDMTQNESLLPAIEIKTQLYDAEALAGDQKCESFI